MSMRTLERSKLKPVAWTCALLAGVLLLGCETLSPEEQAAQDDATCRGYGAEAGSEVYVQCRMTQVSQRQARRQAIAASIGAMGGALRDQPSAGQSTFGAGQSTFGAGTTCFSKGEVTSGMNKICTYDCMGSAAAITQGAASVCPVTITR